MKNTVSYTPGPWTIKDGGISGSDGKLVASDVWYSQTETKTLPNRWYMENGRANAALIAAAPDMLEALKGIVHMCSGTGREYVAVRDAISKATKGGK